MPDAFQLRPPSAAPGGAIAACLAAIRAGDLLASPLSEAWILAADEAHLAMEGDEVLGVGWRREMGGWSAVGASVAPARRRRGLGAALLGRVLEGGGRFYSSLDPTHARGARMLERFGFEQVQLCTLRRWDGVVEDVPPAFRSATLREVRAPERLEGLFAQIQPGVWPPPWLDLSAIERGRVWARIAEVEGEEAGALVAYHLQDAWEIGAFAVAPSWRGRGVGRLLLVEAMRAAAASQRGLALRVPEDELALASLTDKLGFWSFRIWANYRLEPSG